MYIILLLFQIVKSKELFKLEIDQSYQFHREAPNTWVGYPVQYLILEIPKEKSDQDIWVWLIHLNHNSFNSIQLQYSKTDFQVRKVGQQLCLYKDLIICTLQSKLQRHYFQVICQNSCHYEIKVIQEKPDIYLNNFLMIGSKEKTQQNLIKINLTNFEYDRLQLKITFLKDTNISNVYINMNQTIPTTTEFEMSFSIMPNILNNLYFRKNSTYSSDEISLIFETQGGLFFQQKSYNKVENISLYQKLEDEIIKDSINYYQLIIEDFKENSLAFEIFIANDKLLLFIQPCIEAKCEGDYRDFDWQFQFDNYNNLFVIPPYKMVYTKVYLITIITENITQQYTFEVKRIENRREKINFLNSNQGILQKNQMAQFLVESSKWTGDKQLIIQAKFSKGHGIILGKKCSKDSQEMEIIVDEYEYLQNADTNNYYNCSFTQEQFNLYSSDIIQTDTVIEILQNQTESQTNVSMLSFEIFSCNYVYVVAIYSYVDFMQFSMIAQVKSNLVRYIDLRQLEIQYNDLSDQQIENYSIAITYTNQSEVHFCIATYQGELQASFKQQSPTETKLSVNNKVTTLDLISIRYQIVSTYNYFTIYVKGQSYLKFSLIPIIKNLQNPEIQYIRLQQMIPFKTFDLNLYYKIEVLNISHLYINLKSLQGDFICYILSSDKIIGNLTPIQSNLSFTSIHQTIILENPKQFQYLYVKSLSQGINESYQIMYYFSGSFIQLNFGNTFYGMLNDQDKMYFYYQSFKTHQKLYIIKTYQSELNNNNSLQIYISLVNKCPNKFNYKYKIQPSESYIAISNFEQGTIIYIGVHSQGINKYTLLIKEKDQQIELKDNIIQTLPTLEQNYHYFYYVIPRDINNPIKIQAFTKYNLIELLCNIVKFNNQYPEKEFYPTNDDYEIKELPSSNPSNKLVFINLIQLQKCRENGCIEHSYQIFQIIF